MFLLQETKLEQVIKAIANSLWRMKDMEFSYAPSEGMSGGILTLWNTNTVTIMFSFRGNGYLGTKVR